MTDPRQKDPDFASFELRLLGIYQDLAPERRELLAKLIAGEQLTELEKITLDMSTDAFTKRKTEDAVNDIIYCWNCRRALQKPQMFRNIKGKGSNTFRMKCMCGETTEVKF